MDGLNHEDVVKVGKLGILPRYICELWVYGWVRSLEGLRMEPFL